MAECLEVAGTIRPGVLAGAGFGDAAFEMVVAVMVVCALGAILLAIGLMIVRRPKGPVPLVLLGMLAMSFCFIALALHSYSIARPVSLRMDVGEIAVAMASAVLGAASILLVFCRRRSWYVVALAAFVSILLFATPFMFYVPSYEVITATSIGVILGAIGILLQLKPKFAMHIGGTLVVLGLMAIGLSLLIYIGIGMA